MSKFGNLEIPNYPLQESIDAVKKIYDQLKRDEISSDHIASVLGYAPRTGGFNHRLFDLKLYGLLEGRGSKIRVTELAVRATYGTQEEYTAAYDEALRNVPLWEMIFRKWGKSIPAESFYIDLAQMAGVERSESKLEADRIRKLYMDDSKYLLSVKQSPETAEPKNEDKSKDSGKISGDARDRRQPTVEATESLGFVHIKYPGCCDAVIDLQDATSMKAIESMLNIIKPKLPKGNDENPNSNDTGSTS